MARAWRLLVAVALAGAWCGADGTGARGAGVHGAAGVTLRFHFTAGHVSRVLYLERETTIAHAKPAGAAPVGMNDVQRSELVATITVRSVAPDGSALVRITFSPVII